MPDESVSDAAPGADDPVSSAPEPRSERLRRRLGPFGTHRALLIATVACGSLIIISLLWIAITALMARSRLQDAEADLPKLRAVLLSGDLDQARALADDIRAKADSAHSLVSGPAWWVAANLPGVGSPLATTRTVAAAADDVGQDVLPALVSLADTVNGSSLRHGSAINMTVLRDVARTVTPATAAVARAVSAVDGAAHSSWLPPVDSARTKFSSKLDELNAYLVGAQRTLAIALPMLGQSGTQRYFLAFENEAEARGLGGLPGAFAILEAKDGRLTFTHFGNDHELGEVHTGLDFGPAYRASYGLSDPTDTYTNSDISPNFPYAAKIWAAMWQRHTGQHVDGAIALDPTALSYLLKATGPARASDGTLVTSDNVVALTESVQYSKFADRTKRQKWVVGISKAVSKKITSGGNLREFAKAVARAAGERRIVIWSSNPSVEKQLEIADYAGVVPTRPGPFSGFAVVNSLGSKLDYYLDRSITYQRDGCDQGTTAVATMTLTNTAPRSGLPSYVTALSFRPPPGLHPGDNKLIVNYYATAGAVVTGATVDGKPVGVATSTENGLLLVQFEITIKAGGSVTVRLTTREPAVSGPVEILQQPLVRPLHVTTSGATCGS